MKEGKEEEDEEENDDKDYKVIVWFVGHKETLKDSIEDYEKMKTRTSGTNGRVHLMLINLLPDSWN